MDAYAIRIGNQRPHQSRASPVVNGSDPQVASLPFDVGPFVGSDSSCAFGEPSVFARICIMDSGLATDTTSIAVPCSSCDLVVRRGNLGQTSDEPIDQTIDPSIRLTTVSG